MEKRYRQELTQTTIVSASSSDLISFDFSLEFVGRSKLAGPANYFLAREFAGSSFGLLLTYNNRIAFARLLHVKMIVGTLLHMYLAT